MKISIHLVALVSLVLAGLSGQVLASDARDPAWRHSTPEEQGLDSKQLAGMVDLTRQRSSNVHSLVIARNGCIVTEAYFYPFQRDSLHDLASVTKSFTSTLIGIALDQGLIKSVRQPVMDFFPIRSIAIWDARKKAMALEDLLTMRSGLKCITDGGEVTLFEMIMSPDWVQHMLDLPMTDDPGTKWIYNSGGVHLLSAIIRRATGMSALDYARKNLFEPLGIRDVIWPDDPKERNNCGWGGLRLLPVDMAKLGQLYLNKGMWNGRRIVSAEWIAAATGKKVNLPDKRGGYGYLWWVSDSGTYRAMGRGGQQIHVWPDRNMVVAFTAGVGSRPAIDQSPEMLSSYFAATVKAGAPLAPNPKGMALLQAAIRRAAETPPTPPRSVSALPRIARRISGRTYRLDPNPLGLLDLSLTFDQPGEAVLTWRGAFDFERGRSLPTRIGLDGVRRISPGRFGLPAAAEGSWPSFSTFDLDLNEIGNINGWHIRMTFEENRLTMEMQEQTGLGNVTMRGVLADIPPASPAAGEKQ